MISFFNSSIKDKILELSKLKAFADDNLTVNQTLEFLLGKVENIVGKGENDDYQHFLLFPEWFSKGYFLRAIESRDYAEKS